MMVSADKKEFGSIMECNNNLKNMTGFNEANDLRRGVGKYELLMNHMIKKWHSHFVAAFE